MNFDFLFNFFGTVLAFLYTVRPSYAFMIIGLTLIVMVLVTPLTLKATRSMLMMQQLQPEMKKLQSRYKDDRQKLNEELLKFYKENNINPVGGCLPLLVQTPIFLVLYAVLRGLTLRVPIMGSNVGWVAGDRLAGRDLTKPLQVLHLHTFEPKYIPFDSTLYSHMHDVFEMRSLGLDLSTSAADNLSRSIVSALPYLLLIAVVAVSGIVQQRQIQGRNQAATINPQQQMIMKFMPLFLPIFSFALPSALVLYFAVSNTYRVGQQWFISRSIYGTRKAEGEGGADTATGGTGPRGSRGGAEEEPSDKPAGLFDGLLKTLGIGQPKTEPLEAEPEPAKPAPRKAAPRKAAPAKAAARRTPAARATKAAKAPAAKAAEPKAGATARNGRGRAPAPSKEKAATRTSNAPGSSSGRVTPSKKKASSPEPRPSSTSQPPTLQPRARKNKKR
jgi:YidC/Oxa1 family membrane protein insertase